MAHLHFQPAQTSALRILNNKYGQATSAPKRSKMREWSEMAWKLACQFGSRTTVHGLNRLLNEKAGRFERYIWLITVILALIGSIFVCLILSKRFSEGQFETIVDSTRLPVYRIPYPVLTICNLNHLNWQRLEEAKRRFLPKENATSEKLQMFESIIGTYDDLRFANFDKFAVLQSEPLAQLNEVNFSLVFDFMTWRCEEFLSDCVWHYYPIQCCEVFSKRRSKNGLCWSFNTLETDQGRRMKRIDPMWPWRTGSAGPGGGLNARVLINPEKHFPNSTHDKGISVMISEPLVWHKDPFMVPINTQTIIEIEPVIYFNDENMRSVSSEQRECVFEDERNSRDFKSLYGYIYMIENCQSECHQEYLVKYCNCTIDLLFPPGQYRSCSAEDLLCLAKYNENFIYSHQPGEEKYVRLPYEGMVCKCFRNCYSLNYIADVRPIFLPSHLRNNVTYVDLDVHFRFETMMVYRTSLVFGWVDLMVAFGGIVGLFLGCSLISAMEIIYFALIELPNFVFLEVRQRWSQQRTNKMNVEHKLGPTQNPVVLVSQNQLGGIGDLMHNMDHKLQKHYGLMATHRNHFNVKNWS